MRADSLKISKVFSSGGDVHYILPYFQREYAWEKKHWQTLLNDLLGLYETYSSDEIPDHFIGALVVINDGTRNGVIPVFKLVDGQQRLTTISLILCALGEITKGTHPTTYKRIRRLLVNEDEDGLIHFKILPTTKYGDQQAYLALLREEDIPDGLDSKIPEAYHYFKKEFLSRLKSANFDPEKFFLVIANSLQVVFIDLNEDERPYEIFESLNAKGKPLSQADLVRNYIAMKLPEKRQAEIFEKYWSKIENLLQEKRSVGRSRLGELTGFLRHYLALQNGVLPNIGHVYERFRSRIEKDFPTPKAFEEEIATLKRFAVYYDRLLRPAHEPDKEIQILLYRLNIMEVATAYPFLLALYEEQHQGKLTQQEMLDGLSLLENYMVRRYLAGEPTNYLNKMFPTLWREISPRKFTETLRKMLITKNYPTDHRLGQTILSEQLYDNRSQTRQKIVLVLESINRFLSTSTQSGGYTVLDNDPTIEHVLPQTLSSEWKGELGSDWYRVFEDYLNTMGNLTLVTQSWNSSLSNAAFATKQEKLSSHALILNRQYFTQEIESWDEQAIKARAAFLLNAILDIWPQIGVPPVTSKSSGTKPQTLTILGELYEVNSWRDVAYQTSLCISELVDDFETSIVTPMSSYFSKEKYQSACRQLPNGWWLYLNLSAHSIKSFCRNIFALVGFSDEDWEIEEI